MAKHESNIMKAKRELVGLKQSELGRLIGRSQAWISAAELGKMLPQPEEQQKLERILNGPDEDFLCRGLIQEQNATTSLEHWFQRVSMDLTWFIREAEQAGDLDAAKRLLWLKRFFNVCVYKRAVEQ